MKLFSKSKTSGKKSRKRILKYKNVDYKSHNATKRGVLMQKEEFEKVLKDMPEPKKGILANLFKDFLWLDEQIEALRVYPRYKVNGANPDLQKKLPVHEMLKDYQAQKNDIATKILRTLDGVTDGESELMKALNEVD